jgi:hypothetical protein
MDLRLERSLKPSASESEIFLKRRADRSGGRSDKPLKSKPTLSQLADS